MNVGFVVSAIVVGGGLLWIFIRSLRGKDVDRRIVFGFVGITVALAVLFQLKFGEVATPIVKTLFEKIETLPPGSKIVISFDFDPAMAPEVLPMANSFTRHALAKGHRIYFFSIWATGQSLLQVTLHDIVEKEFPDAVYGIDYVNMGYKAGNEGVLNVIITDIRKMYPGDVNGTSLDSIPMMKDVHPLKDMDLLCQSVAANPVSKNGCCSLEIAATSPPVAVQRQFRHRCFILTTQSNWSVCWVEPKVPPSMRLSLSNAIRVLPISRHRPLT
ncbi:MAG: hypothetical protein IPH59_10175 [bacterium]|nr:hypothetical protein [bacterium]